MSQAKSHKILQGAELIAILRVTKAAVKWIRPGAETVRLDPAMAEPIVRAGMFEGKASSTRVYTIRELRPSDLAPYYPWVECFRTCEAPILPPSPEYFARMGYDRPALA